MLECGDEVSHRDAPVFEPYALASGFGHRGQLRGVGNPRRAPSAHMTHCRSLLDNVMNSSLAYSYGNTREKNFVKIKLSPRDIAIATTTNGSKCFAPHRVKIAPTDMT